MISTFAIVTPVQAHFTIGNLTSAYRFHRFDFDPHISGPIGYVWPGGGQNAYDGSPNLASAELSPGYESPYPCRLSGEDPGQVPGDQCNPVDAPASSWYQLQGNAYAPFGAVLTSSTGDLIFALNATAGFTQCDVSFVGSTGACAGTPNTGTNNVCTSVSGIARPCGWDIWMILIPPGFGVSTDPSQIASTLTNTYSNIFVTKLSPYDRYAPNWTMISIRVDAAINGRRDAVSYYNHQFINFTTAGEWYYARVNGVTAPATAGRYFFKMFLSGGSDVYGVGPTLPGSNSCSTPPTSNCPVPSGLTNDAAGMLPDVWVNPANWPVMLVKGEIDPAIITGTIRYGGYNSTLYGQPVGEAGRVWAKMETKLDPYTGTQVASCPAEDYPGESQVLGCTDAIGYWNTTAVGHYEVEGVASGVYTIYAEAAGFPQTVIESGVTMLKGQSLHFDGYLQPGPVIHGNVFTKHQFGDEPWMGELPLCQTSPSAFPDCSTNTYNEYIKIEFYDSPTLSNIPDPSAHLVSWSPLPCTAGGQELYYGNGHASYCGDPRTGSNIAFPWHEYNTVCAYLSTTTCPYGSNIFAQGKTATFTNGYSRDVSESTCPLIHALAPSCSTAPASKFSDLTSDPEGVGPPQHWFVQGGTTSPFHFEFGVKAEYGAPRDLDGQVPQVYATWVNGLTPGRYYARAWVFRYVQTALDGSTFQEYYFDVTPQEWAGDVALPIDLRLSSWVNKTVHYHNLPGTINEDAINTGAGFLYGNLQGTDGQIYAYNVTGLGLNGFYAGGVGAAYVGCRDVNPGPSFNPLIIPHLFLCGYFFNPTALGSLSLQYYENLDPAGLNAHAIESGRANIQFWGINDTWSGENYGIPSGTYSVYTATEGYVQESPAEQVSVTLSGTVTQVSDHMYRGAGFNVTLYSVDWERPTVNRPWVWGNDQGGLGTLSCLNNGPVCSTPTAPPFACATSGVITGAGCNQVQRGSEIDLGFYSNDALAGALGDEFEHLPVTLPTTGLFQGVGSIPCPPDTTIPLSPDWTGRSCTMMDGGGREIRPTGSDNANMSYFGYEAADQWVGGNTPGVFGWLVASSLHPDFTSTATWPGSFRTGEYELRGWTYGYVQDQIYSVYVQQGQVADVRINLVVGVNVTLDILLKKEHLITDSQDNMSARVRLFDDSGNLVAEWMSSEGTYTPPNSGATVNGVAQNGRAVAADGTTQYPFISQGNMTMPGSQLNSYNFVPGGVSLLHVLMAGLPQQPPTGMQFTGQYFGDPVFTPYSCDFEIVCLSKGTYGRYLPSNTTAPQYPFANTGILGYPDYQGGWTAEVDFVNWYANNSATPEPLSVCGSGEQLLPYQSGLSVLPNPPCTSSGVTFQQKSGPAYPQYYPPVNGLLMGESFHIIPGTTATTGISLTEDAAAGTYLQHSMAVNHLGPYSQEGVWQISGAHLSGEASGIFEVDLNGFISGTALAFTWANDFRPLSWATVSVVGASGSTWNYYTYDGEFQMYLPEGTYSLTISSPGIAAQTLTIAVTGGEAGTAANVYMQQTNVPVPEFTGISIVAFLALATSFYLLRRRGAKPQWK